MALLGVHEGEMIPFSDDFNQFFSCALASRKNM